MQLPNSTDKETTLRSYVGETDDLEDNFMFHRKQTCFDKKGATHICVHLDSAGESRKAKEADLLAAYDWPCND